MTDEQWYSIPGNKRWDRRFIERVEKEFRKWLFEYKRGKQI